MIIKIPLEFKYPYTLIFAHHIEIVRAYPNRYKLTETKQGTLQSK